VPLALRRDRLLRVRALLNDNSDALAAAVQADFGVRSPQLTEVADLFVLRTMLSHTLKAPAALDEAGKVSTPIYLQPAAPGSAAPAAGRGGRDLALELPGAAVAGPVITALAAGNRVMLKPSELTPHTSALLGELLEKRVCTRRTLRGAGRWRTGSAEFAGLPFDHLFFTGSTAVGRKVAQAAAANLTPTTLELGGKSPCIIDAVLRHGRRCDQDRPRQAAQRRPDLHCARLRAAARGQRSRVRRSLCQGCGGAAVPHDSKATPTTPPSSARATMRGCRPC
jgi:coniferyl-aldehyde dehydrogenase